jgi:hypothetical protein
VREFLASKQITVLGLPAPFTESSPQLHFSVPEDKGSIEGFADIDDIRSNTTAALYPIPQNQLQIVLEGGLGAGMGA